METADEIRLLNKELAFLETRWRSFLHNLKVIRCGKTTAIVNGVASNHYYHYMYLENRRMKVIQRLKELR